MANYLAGLGTTAILSSAGGAAGVVASSPQSSSGPSSALTSALAFGGLGMGSKPKALHTEYASGSANWQKPYGSGTDIVFYMVRADSGQPGTEPNSTAGSTPNSPSKNQSSSVGSPDTLTSGGDVSAASAAFGSATQTGPGYPSNVQSPLNQVATASTVRELASAPGPVPGLAGPLTGLKTAQEVEIGAISQTFAQLSSTSASVRNLTGSVRTSSSLRLSMPSSEKYFSDVLQESFSPGSLIAGNRSASQIESSFDRGATAALAVDLAVASGGVTTSKQLIEGINKGAIGFSTISSRAEASRLGPQGYSRERLAK